MIPPLHNRDLFLRQPIQLVHQRVDVRIGGLDLPVVQVLVDGNLDISEYTDKEGQKRTTFRIPADVYWLL